MASMTLTPTLAAPGAFAATASLVKAGRKCSTSFGRAGLESTFRPNLSTE